jgi:hypothetical protein
MALVTEEASRVRHVGGLCIAYITFDTETVLLHAVRLDNQSLEPCRLRILTVDPVTEERDIHQDVGTDAGQDKTTNFPANRRISLDIAEIRLM